jgi:hypothetical protein
MDDFIKEARVQAADDGNHTRAIACEYVYVYV